MKAAAVRALIDADSRLLWRDPLLGWVLALPIGLALLLRALIPRIHDALLATFEFDLTAYYPLVLGGYLMTAPGMVGMVIGFLFLDERDSRTLAALRTTPLSMRQYLAYRIALPLLLGTASTLIGYPLIGLVPLRLSALLAIASVASLSAPTLALVLAIAAPNKVAGFAVVKVINVVNLLPVVAYFVPVRCSSWPDSSQRTGRCAPLGRRWRVNPTVRISSSGRSFQAWRSPWRCGCLTRGWCDGSSWA